VGLVDLVIAGWPCQGHTRAGHGDGLHNPQSRVFWEMLRVIRHLQLHQTRPPAYILENVPLLGDTRSRVMTSVHQVRSWIGPAVLLDAARVGSRAHRPRLWWTNLLPREVLRRAYDSVQRNHSLTVDSILDVGRHAQRVRVADRSPMARVNLVGQPRMALPTFVSYPSSHAYRDGGPGLVWDMRVQQLVEPTADERERAMGFTTGVTAVPSISEASRRHVLGQAMDLNCLTWIFSLGMAEQRRLRTTCVIERPLVMSTVPTGTVEALAGGEGSTILHPWRSWDVIDEHVELIAHVDGGVVGSDDGVEEHAPSFERAA
jgi:C-5 cytosine-specific DNA methylase